MKTKRKLKGMTLMEVVVSLAVYAVIGLLIAEIMTLVNATMKATNQLNRRLSYEAKFADNLLRSDGVEDFVPTGCSIVLHGPSNAFNVPADGTSFLTSAEHMERQEQNLIINGQTNYRFLVFGKREAGAPTTIPVFFVNLNLGECDDITTNPITKIIVKGQGVPARKGMFELGKTTGNLYQQQVITQTYPAPAGDTGNDADHPNYGIAVVDSMLENHVANDPSHPILRIAVPAVEDDGVTSIVSATDPHGPVRGKLTVLIFRELQDLSRNKYNWYKPADVDKLKIGFPVGDPTADSQRFPASAVLNLDFVLSTENPNTHERTFFDSVTYTWNPQKDPKGNEYLVPQEAHGRR